MELGRHSHLERETFLVCRVHQTDHRPHLLTSLPDQAEQGADTRNRLEREPGRGRGEPTGRGPEAAARGTEVTSDSAARGGRGRRAASVRGEASAGRRVRWARGPGLRPLCVPRGGRRPGLQPHAVLGRAASLVLGWIGVRDACYSSWSLPQPGTEPRAPGHSCPRGTKEHEGARSVTGR